MPQTSWITGAGENDLTAVRHAFDYMSNCKIYADSDLNNRLQANQNSIILTPAKKEKGQKTLNAADDIYSYLVSKVRQPIESLFNYLT
jgi:hypothetical protein